MASEQENFKLVVWTVVGLVVFWIVAIPTMILGGPSNNKTGGGSVAQ